MTDKKFTDEEIIKGLKFCEDCSANINYCDKRTSTNLTQFNYCPLCGKKIDWKAIKGGANG